MEVLNDDLEKVVPALVAESRRGLNEENVKELRFMQTDKKWGVSQEGEVHENGNSGQNMEGVENQVANGDKFEEEMVEGSDHDTEERDDDDDDYVPDVESIGSEEGATSDEEYVPSFTKTVKPAQRKLVPAQLLDNNELSAYEKIRADNIKQKEEMLNILKLNWDEFKKGEGLLAGESQKRKKVDTVEREVVVNTRMKRCTLRSFTNKEVKVDMNMNQPAGRGQVSKKSVKGSRAVLINCEDCGEEVRKTLLKTHIRFYHHKVKAQKSGSAAKEAGSENVQALSKVSIEEAQRLIVDQQSPCTVKRSHNMVAPLALAPKESQKKHVVDPLFTNIRVSPVPTTSMQSATFTFSSKNLSSQGRDNYPPVAGVQSIMVSSHASMAKQVSTASHGMATALPSSPGVIGGLANKPPTGPPTTPSQVQGVSSVASSLKTIKARVNSVNLEAAHVRRPTVSDYGGRAQNGEINYKQWADNKHHSEALSLRCEFNQDVEDNSAVEKLSQCQKVNQEKTKCTHCGEMLPDDAQILKLHEDVYHFQAELLRTFCCN